MDGGFVGLLGMAGLVILFGGSLISRRLLFTAVATLAAVCFSECVYWYKEGYHDLFIWNRVNTYLAPTFFCFWAIGAFNVRRLAPLFLCAALYGLTVEGGIVWIIFEHDNWNPINLVNTPMNWHAPISVMFGIFYLRHSLQAKSLKWLLVGCIAMGVFWGVWSTTQWLPETVADYSEEDDAVLIGRIPFYVFGLYAFMVTCFIALAHWVLYSGRQKNGTSAAQAEPMFPVFTLSPKFWKGTGVWLREFQPHPFEAIVIVVYMWAWHVSFCLPMAVTSLGVSATLAKLPLAVGVILLALWASKRQEKSVSIFESMARPIRVSRVPGLFLMPIVAMFTYLLIHVLNPPVEIIERYYIGIVIVTIYAGFAVFLLSILLCLFPPYFRRATQR